MSVAVLYPLAPSFAFAVGIPPGNLTIFAIYPSVCVFIKSCCFPTASIKVLGLLYKPLL